MTQHTFDNDAAVDNDSAPPVIPNEPMVWTRPAPKLGPALIVVGLAVFLIVAGGVLAIFANGGSSPTTSGSPNATVAKSVLAPTSLHPLLKRVATASQPPKDIQAALFAPVGSKVVSSRNDDRGVTPFDRSIKMNVPDTAKNVENFYRYELAHNNWTSRSTSSSANNGLELFGRHQSSDGFYWEVGIVVTPANPSISPALSGDSAAPLTKVEVRIFEVDDEE